MKDLDGCSAAPLVTVEDEAPALDTVLVGPQGDAHVAFESESAGLFAINVHFQCTRTQRPTPTLVHAITSTRTCELCMYAVPYL
jgi:hypothetical protein